MYDKEDFMSTRMAQMEAIIREAGKFFSYAIDERETIRKEGTANFATQVDFLVQDFLVEKLSEMIPGSNIITEESDDNQYHLTRPTWILDPVDGTINFAHHFHHSAISLALFEENRPDMSVIYNPTADEMFTAEWGKGAFLNGVPIYASSLPVLNECLLLFGTTPYHREKAKESFNLAQCFFMKCQDIRRSGSAALDIAYIAAGRADGFFEMNLQPWDYAAGMLLLKEAGGSITRWNGEPLSVLSPGSVLATNGFVHEEMLQVISTSYRSDE